MLTKRTFSTLALLSFTCFSPMVQAMKTADVLNLTENFPADIKSRASTVASRLEGKLENYERTRDQMVNYYGEVTRFEIQNGRNPSARLAPLDAILSFLDGKLERTGNKLSRAEALRDGAQTIGQFNRQEKYGLHAQLLKEGRQEEADTYALLRYFIYNDMYDAIPNPENSVGREHLIRGAVPKGFQKVGERAVASAQEDNIKSIANTLNLSYVILVKDGLPDSGKRWDAEKILDYRRTLSAIEEIIKFGFSKVSRFCAPISTKV